MPGALEHARAVHDVAARGREAVEQQDGRALAGLLAAQRDALPLDREGRGRRLGAQAAIPEGAEVWLSAEGSPDEAAGEPFCPGCAAPLGIAA